MNDEERELARRMRDDATANGDDEGAAELGWLLNADPDVSVFREPEGLAR